MTIEQDILDNLKSLEQERSINILLAIESGSRAWGFPSQDSDYDVRIIYSHPVQHYLSVFDRKDTLEVPITNELDIAGWEIAKALKLMYAGNAVVHEWLNSPIIYQENSMASNILRNFSQTAFNPVKAFHHYLAMSAKKFDLDGNESFSAKRLLYAYRTLLCALWVKNYQTPPPMKFQDLMTDILHDRQDVFDALTIIITAKKEQTEKQPIDCPKLLIEYSRSQIKELKATQLQSYKAPKKEEFDTVFRTLINNGN
ncbi:nucleotidyltransferase domain-containing protein [Pleionea sediminis]|uniref:nucleotidyltransferase domain-containing protein n=1 Tax=Pleionea sediminis TaxID=2569479 RepID=UPI0011868482|nr:nucleotidyltransferase domain-containing protein [Pleionea sediminis]